MKTILITEDEPIVALDLERRLSKLGYLVVKATTGDEAVRRAAELRPDLVLMDICLPGETDGIAAAARIRDAHQIPVVYLSANADETTLKRAKATHPASYLLKPFRERELHICLEMALINDHLRRQLKEANSQLEERVRQRTAELEAANATLRAEIDARTKAERQIREQAELLEKARDAIHVERLDGCIVYWNRGAERLYSTPAPRAIGARMAELARRENHAQLDPLRETLDHGEWVGELTLHDAAGKSLIVESRWTLVLDDRGAPASVLIVETDISERKAIANQLLHAQRLESIGSLASGIAHDLNNVFTPLIMAAQSLSEAPAESPNSRLAEIILASSQRGAEMVRQILLFVRGIAGERVPLRLEHIIKEVQNLLRETFPRSIRIRTRTDADTPLVLGDPTQFHQLLMNLCVNARDAMPAGGDLVIELQRSRHHERAVREEGTAAGEYVRVSVRDTGTGMSPEVREQIFTPFFTTKGVGRGTGLGLSTVQAIARNHGGFIEVESSPGAGTCFHVYLPARTGDEGELELTEVEAPGGHGERLLVIDDEAMVREMLKATLEAHGYRVTLAHDGLDAIAQFARQPDDFAAAICDGSMPFLDGLGCARGLRRITPSLPVLLVSGSETAASTAAQAQPGDFLPKPFTHNQLLHAVHGLLQDKARGGSGASRPSGA